MERSNQSDTEFKIVFLRMLIELERIHELSENIKKEKKCKKKDKKHKKESIRTKEYNNLNKEYTGENQQQITSRGPNQQYERQGSGKHPIRTKRKRI